MNCEVFEVLISAYADGELNSHDAARVEAHISNCEFCRDFYEQTVAVQKDIVKAFMECPAVPDLVSSVADRMQPRRTLRLTWGWAAAAAVIILAVGLFANLYIKSTDDTAPVIATTKINVNPDIPVKAVKRHIVKKPVKQIVKQEPEKIELTITPKVEELPKVQQVAYADPAQLEQEQAEVTINYTDSDQPDSPEDNQYPLAPEPLPVVGPGQKIVAENEIVTIDGRRVQRVAYKIVESIDETPQTGEPDGDE